MDGPKLRPETSTSVGIGDSGWDDMRCIYLGSNPYLVIKPFDKGSGI